MNESGIQEPSKHPSMYDPPSHPVDGNHDGEITEPSSTRPNSALAMSALRDAVASKGLGAISGYRAVNSHHAATPPPEIYPYRGQETEAAVFSPGSGQLLQASNDLTYLLEDTLDTYYPSPWPDHFPHLQALQSLPAQFSSRESTGHFTPDHVTDGLYPPDQYSHTEESYNSSIYDEGRPWFSDIEETYEPHRTEETLAPLDSIRPTFVGERGHANQSLSGPTVGVEGKQITTRGSSSVRTNDGGIKNPNKRERDTSPEGEAEGKRTRNKRRNLEVPQEFIPSDPYTTLPTRGPYFRAVVQIRYRCDVAQKHWKPLRPISFTVKGNEGINLVDAENMGFSNLDNRDEKMFTDGKTGGSVSLRIDFMGHIAGDHKARQIATTNYKREHGPITRQKLGREVAKLIEEHLKKGKNSFHIPFKQMFLVRLHNVSHASWQPELWWRDSPSTSS